MGYNRLFFFVRRVSLSVGVAGGFYGALGARCSLPGLGLALICRTAAAVRALATRQLHRAPKRAAPELPGPKALTTTYQGFWKIHCTWQLHKAKQAISQRSHKTGDRNVQDFEKYMGTYADKYMILVAGWSSSVQSSDLKYPPND